MVTVTSYEADAQDVYATRRPEFIALQGKTPTGEGPWQYLQIIPITMQTTLEDLTPLIQDECWIGSLLECPFLPSEWLTSILSGVMPKVRCQVLKQIAGIALKNAPATALQRLQNLDRRRLPCSDKQVLKPLQGIHRSADLSEDESVHGNQ